MTNGSTDNTIDICKELKNNYSNKVLFYNKANLYENRAFAFSKTKYRWIMRGEAYTEEDGNNSIKK